MKGKELLTTYYDEILSLLNMVKVGIWITDENGRVLMVNKESESSGSLKTDQLIGRTMEELKEIGYIDESCTLMALENQTEYSMIQKMYGDGSIYITAEPFRIDDEIDMVISTERDITETIQLGQLLEETKRNSQVQEKELEYLRKRNKNEKEFIARSDKMIKLLESAERIAGFDTTVLITGESGTGKEVMADYIVRKSNRAEKPFIKINCAAIPENLLESELFGYEKGAFTGADADGKAGIFEAVNGGTLLLDEIGEMPIGLQTKLLRAIQEKEIRRVGSNIATNIDVRIIAATNADLQKAVENGTFRQDLYYRLNIVPIEMPPLRERREDIELLAKHFLDAYCREYHTVKKMNPEVIKALSDAEWHGNVRELKNMMERFVISTDETEINLNQIRELFMHDSTVQKAFNLDEDISLGEIMDEYEKAVLTDYLEKYSSAAEVARRLKVNKSTISRKLIKHGIISG